MGGGGADCEGVGDGEAGLRGQGAGVAGAGEVAWGGGRADRTAGGGGVAEEPEALLVEGVQHRRQRPHPGVRRRVQVPAAAAVNNK